MDDGVGRCIRNYAKNAKESVQFRDTSSAGMALLNRILPSFDLRLNDNSFVNVVLNV